MKQVSNFFNLIALTLLFIFSILIISCNKEQDKISSVEENLNMVEQNSKMVEYGATIPVSINYENNKAYVGFIISAQWYTIDLSTSKRTKEIELITTSIKTERPLRIFLKENTTEIAKIEEMSKEEIIHFRSTYDTKDKESKATTLNSVIPNQNRLTALFNTIKNNSCGASTAPNTCITFRYAVDGCYARAHKIRQILSNYGYSCRKQFVYGNLVATTGSCCVNWGYHVAVLVKFRNANGVIQERIIDPSLFPSGPVSASIWRNACVNNSYHCNLYIYFGTPSIATFVNTSGSVYYRNPNSGSLSYDSYYTHTNCTLAAYKYESGCIGIAPPNCY